MLKKSTPLLLTILYFLSTPSLYSSNYQGPEICSVPGHQYFTMWNLIHDSDLTKLDTVLTKNPSLANTKIDLPAGEKIILYFMQF